jgi:dTDP-4-amino-4,6-dideoxygalactose transaminase
MQTPHRSGSLIAGLGRGGLVGACPRSWPLKEMTMIPYSRPYWTEAEVEAVSDVIRSGWWTAGAEVQRLENVLARVLGAVDVVCMSSGTAAIQALLSDLKRPGRSLFVSSALNFIAGPACAMHCGFEVALTDIDIDDLNMSPSSLEGLLTRTGGDFDQIVVMPVHFAGSPVRMDEIVDLVRSHDGEVIEDASHAIIARYDQESGVVGSHPESIGATFSFHPNKPVASGEGGAVAICDPELGQRLRSFRNHNMLHSGFTSAAAYDTDGTANPWFYEIVKPGTNFRLSELHAALALVQLERLKESLSFRRRLANRYRESLSAHSGLLYVPAEAAETSALHLFPVSFDLRRLGRSKRQIFDWYHRHEIGVQVHYSPLYEQPVVAGMPLVTDAAFPVLDDLSPGMLSLPLFMGLSDAEQDHVITTTLALLDS